VQKDTHYYLTYALARTAGIETPTALKIAWANQFTDECTDAGRLGMQTQVRFGPFSNWSDVHVQNTVLVPFHFIPGRDSQQESQWQVTEASDLADQLAKAAVRSKNPFRFGIALHTWQDTFSHAGFTGRREKINNRFSWYNPTAAIMPDVGHADLGPRPDIIFDPNNQIDNRTGALRCAATTLVWMNRFAGNGATVADSLALESALERAFSYADYDERKKAIAAVGKSEMTGDSFRFGRVNKGVAAEWRGEFVSAARIHLGLVMAGLNDLL